MMRLIGNSLPNPNLPSKFLYDANFRSLMGCHVTYVNKPKNKMAAVAPKLHVNPKILCHT